MDAMRVQQVLLNLLTNAVKFSPKDDTVKVFVKTHEDIDMESYNVEIRVVDFGIGINEED
jgi:two-component system phosphate regulon sensor histidine kinase PhoR